MGKQSGVSYEKELQNVCNGNGTDDLFCDCYGDFYCYETAL